MAISLYDHANGTATFRAAGKTCQEVKADLAVMEKLLPTGSQMFYLGPVLWGDEYVAYGEIKNAPPKPRSAP